jgi:hypothetical protein
VNAYVTDLGTLDALGWVEDTLQDVRHGVAPQPRGTQTARMVTAMTEVLSADWLEALADGQPADTRTLYLTAWIAVLARELGALREVAAKAHGAEVTP